MAPAAQTTAGAPFHLSERNALACCRVSRPGGLFRALSCPVAGQRGAAAKCYPLYFLVVLAFGGSLLLAYALWRRDPVFIIGQTFGLLVYACNLMLIRQAGAEGRVS